MTELEKLANWQNEQKELNKLVNWIEEQEKNGLVDINFSLGDVSESTRDTFAEEVNRMLTAPVVVDDLC